MLGDRFDDVLERAQRGDALAFAQLWRDAQPMLLRYLWVVESEPCEEIASDVWSRVIRSLGGFSGSEAGFRRLLAAVAHQQRAHRIQQCVATSGDPGAVEPGVGERTSAPAYVAADEGATRAALSHIARLPPEQAEPVVLHVAMGLDVADIAEVIGRPPGAVRVAVHWALLRLEYMITADTVGLASPGEASVLLDDTATGASPDGLDFPDDFGVADMFLAGRTDVLSSDVDAVLAAASAPASALELGGAREAVAAFLALGPGATPVADPFASGPRVLYRVKHRLVTAAVASAVLLTGLSAAAHAGVLPGPIQNVANTMLQAGAPTGAAGHGPTRTSAPKPTTPRAPKPTAKPTPRPTTTKAKAPTKSKAKAKAPSTLALCKAYAKGGTALSSTARAQLAKAAGGQARIPFYCAKILFPGAKHPYYPYYTYYPYYPGVPHPKTPVPPPTWGHTGPGWPTTPKPPTGLEPPRS